jgi:dUTP pyrophosphatase
MKEIFITNRRNRRVISPTRPRKRHTSLHHEFNNMELQVEIINTLAQVPKKANNSDAAFDLYCPDDCTLEPQGMTLVNLGIKIAIPEGYFGLIRGRSSVESKGAFVQAGVIDSGYRGEVKVLFHNSGPSIIAFGHGHKIAQLLILPVPSITVKQVETLNTTQRGEGGFGSTGR